MEKMYAALLEEYKHFRWKEVDKPTFTDDEVLIKVEYAGICGTDHHIFLGEFHPRTPVPFIPGHEFSGIIVETGRHVMDFKVGDRVAVDPIIWCGKCPACKREHYTACSSLKLLGVDMNGGFGQYINVKPYMLFKVDPSIPPAHAALVEVLSIGFHACNRADVGKNDSIVIWGAGKVGQCVLQAARTRTRNTIILVDILDNRLRRAKEAYPDIHTVNCRIESPIDRIMEITDSKGVDIAFEVVGNHVEISNIPNPVRGCVQSIRGAGIVCVLGLSDDPAPVLFKELIWKEAKIVTSRVSLGEFSEAIENLEKKTLKPDVLVTDILELSEIQKGFEMLEDDPENHLKILIKLDPRSDT
ncbi:MAG: alcohol dehydrogenase catalytic domain-containing protein [Chitinispirillia bacterium]|jgi:threonine dehydrogenase-like Zn-dependent dehydrogenase